MIGVKSAEPREKATFFVPTALMRVLRAVSEETGVPMSRLVTRGLEGQLEKYQLRPASPSRVERVG